MTAAVLEDEGGSYRVYGEDTLGGNVAVNGGAELAVGKHGENGNISAEDLIAVNPDAIFMVWYDGYSVGDVDYAGEHDCETDYRRSEICFAGCGQKWTGLPNQSFGYLLQRYENTRRYS